MTRPSSRRWHTRIAIGLLALCLSCGLEWGRPGMLTRLDEGIRDRFVSLMADKRPEERLTIVDISEAALKDIGPWPWPRHKLADLADILLGTYGVRSVALDMVLPDPGDESGDVRLSAMAAHAPLVLAQIFDFVQRETPILQGWPSAGVTYQPSAPAEIAFGHIANHAGLSAARCVGNIGYQPDADGVLRHLPTVTLYRDQVYPTLARAILACTNNLNSVATPADLPSSWRVPYTRALSAYTVISATDVLREAVPHALLANRHVIVGSSALSIGDRVSTPLAPLNAGVLVHAASLTGLLDLGEGRIRKPWSGRSLMLIWLLSSIALSLVGISRLAAWGGVTLLLSVGLGWLVLAITGVAHQAEWSVTAPLWAYLLLLLIAVPHEWWQTQRHSRRLMATFSHYVAQPVLDEIVRLGLAHSLQPRLRSVTILIADMEGYTRMTSSMHLEEAAALTKEFLGCLTRPVLEGRGTLDKYTGDGLVAFWGAPLPCDDQADRAVCAALQISNEVALLNQSRERQGLAPVRVRVGIESGDALVGDLGTSFRSTYTAVGDCINFASRLESAAKDFPSGILIGPQAQKQLTRYRASSAGKLALRGTGTTIEVFTVNP